jgi:hypothetical protein
VGTPKNVTGGVVEKVVVELPVSKVCISLLGLSQILHMDFGTLALLYEKYGVDVLYFFYLLAGSSIKLPRISRLQQLFEESGKIAKAFDSGSDYDPESLRNKTLLRAVCGMYDVGTHKLKVELEVIDGDRSNTGIL